MIRYATAPGLEGDVCVFELPPEASPIAVESVTGRPMMLAPGDVFLATAGYRESTRWVVGGIPDGGLVPGIDYWVLAESGVVGDLIGDPPRAKSHLGQVKYLGTVRDKRRRRESRRFPQACPAQLARNASKRARQDSNLRPPA